MISVSHLTKRYGAQLAVDDVSFEIGQGEVVGFLGPNGAGKSTTLRVVAGFLGPTAGTVRVAGHDVVDDSLAARRCVGYMPENVPLYPEMRVVEYLRFRAELKRVARAQRVPWVDDAMGKAGVLDVAHRRIGHLSKGYRQRVGLADALVARPPVVVLDEPTAGLDPNQIRETRELVRQLGRDHTVILSTHILGEVEACATRVLLVHRGRLVAQGPTDSIRAMRGPTGVDLVLGGDVSAAQTAIAELAGAGAGIAKVTREDGPRGPAVHEGAGPRPGDAARLRVRFAKDTTEPARLALVERCVAAAVHAGAGVREVRAAGGSLEEVFAALTAAGAPEDGDAQAREKDEGR